MELKPYQQKVINDLEKYLLELQQNPSASQAFKAYWAAIAKEYQLSIEYDNTTGNNKGNNKGDTIGIKPYKNNIPNAVHIAIKVPTAGGKTFIACNALHTIQQHFTQGNLKTVVWLVPWSNLLQQTVASLSNPNHPYRAKLNTLFGNRVEVYEKSQLLQGANFNPTSVTEQLNILVFNFSSIRINSNKKDDRKIFQENGALEAFRNTIVDDNLILPDTDATSLINVIRSLNPVVIVDESHNAESDLSVEMLNNLNPSLILDLTATPKPNSNIISFVNALALKRENMVKLPVIVYNHHKKEDVINNALHLRRELELLAIEEEKQTGRYIRPIILFQAQSNIKGKDNTTFQKIKEKLIKIGIPEEEIKIKVSGCDELKDIDLSAKTCPVRYIITINALKEGWDCPNAYILASLADKSSAVDVEQILGRILRLPHVAKNRGDLLNSSYVLTASSKFQDTLDNIVKGLQESGFSEDDYYAKDLSPAESTTPVKPVQTEIFNPPITPESKELVSDDEFDTQAVNFDPNEKVTLTSLSQVNNPISEITKKAATESRAFEERANAQKIDDETLNLAQNMQQTVKSYPINAMFVEYAKEICLPQFFRKIDGTAGQGLFEELKESEILLQKESLLDTFEILKCDTIINFDEVGAELFKVDIDDTRKIATITKANERAKKVLLDSILSKPQEEQIMKVADLMVRKLGDMSPIPHKNLKKYIERVFEGLSPSQIRDLVDNEFKYISQIKKKIETLKATHARERFKGLMDSNKIIVKPNFSFSDEIDLFKVASPIDKSLYEREAPMNDFEQSVIMDIASLPNVAFWHRNLERGKGFFLNGYDQNHYPDFIIYTTKRNIILLETKGDRFDNDESHYKNELGKKWAEKLGEKHKYFMVFETKYVPNTYTSHNIKDIIKAL